MGLYNFGRGPRDEECTADINVPEGVSHLSAAKAIDNDEYEFDIKQRKRDDEDHFIIHAQHKELDWCKVGIRIICRLNDVPELHCSFGIDRIGYALEQDCLPQQQAVKAASKVVAQTVPSLDADKILDQRLEASFSRIRQRWADNLAKGYSVEKFSIYRHHKDVLVLAAPSTALGSNEIVGVQQNYNASKFERYSTVYHPNVKRLLPITQKVLKDNPKFSGHEKLQLLSGEATELLRAAKQVLHQWRFYPCYRNGHCFGYGGHQANAWQSFNNKNYVFDFEVSFVDGGRFSINCDTDDTSNHEGKKRHQLNVRSFIAEGKLNIVVDRNRHDGTFRVTGGVGAKEFFPSIDDLNLSFQTLLRRIIAADPVWPQWVYDACNTDFEPGHCAISDLHIPQRHQPIVAMILHESYETNKKRTVNFIKQHAKKTEKVDESTSTVEELADGTVFGKIKTGHLKTWKRIEYPWNTRIYVCVTTSEKGAKQRTRSLVPFCGAVNPRPFTAKQVARLTPYNKVDALRLFPDDFLGGEKRDVVEAAFRVSLELSSMTENPLLNGTATISFFETERTDFNVRFTEFKEENGYRLMAYSVIQSEASRSRDAYLGQYTGSGIAVLDTPKGRQIYLRPSLIKENDHLPEREWMWLRQAVAKSFAFEPSHVEEIADLLDNEWKAEAKQLGLAADAFAETA